MKIKLVLKKKSDLIFKSKSKISFFRVIINSKNFREYKSFDLKEK